jgi:hypothetical protein
MATSPNPATALTSYPQRTRDVFKPPQAAHQPAPATSAKFKMGDIAVPTDFAHEHAEHGKVALGADKSRVLFAI